MHRFTAAALLLFLPAPAVADTFDGCFTRTYDAAHLAAHKGQTVRSVMLKLKPRQMDDGYSVSAELRFDFRDDKRGFYAVGICKEGREGVAGLYCGLDQDAGELSIKPSDTGLQVSPINDLRADPDTGDETGYVMIRKDNSEDRVFALHAAPAADCKEFDTDE